MELIYALLTAMITFYQWTMKGTIIVCLIIYMAILAFIIGCLVYCINSKLIEWKSRKGVK